MTLQEGGKEPLYTLSLRFPYPEYKKGRLATLNALPQFYRYGKTKIKRKLLEFLDSWSLDEPHDGSGREMVIEFTIMRHNKRRIDADSLAWWSKIVCDHIVNRGYLKDDDRTTFIYHPSVYVDNISSTEIECNVIIY